MRIISGIYGGRRLQSPKDSSVRPTSDKVRGSIFNILRWMDCLKNARVLDVFCGTGALGLEALSQGAAHCSFVDKAQSSIDLARRNADSLGALEACTFLRQDGVRVSARGPFDAVFCDPPYGKGLIPQALAQLHGRGVLAIGAVLVVEAEKGFVANFPEVYVVLDVRTYGDSQIFFLRYDGIDPV